MKYGFATLLVAILQVWKERRIQLRDYFALMASNEGEKPITHMAFGDLSCSLFCLKTVAAEADEQ